MDKGSIRKRLGQYFTGSALARLLVAFADADKANTILDPMAGSGDMLVACRKYGARDAVFGAVEIDPIAINLCNERAPWSHPILGNAFDQKTLAGLPTRQWDLVITNPPYVRYQRLSKNVENGFYLPTGAEVRNSLLLVIDRAIALDDEDQRLFKNLVSGYSGLADLAVPSWILCASLCAPGGKLALVLPESWLSRDYATVIQYLLLRWFKIKYLVEDAHAAWFPDAQVKTMLLVAERTERRKSAFDWEAKDSFLHLRISGQAIGPDGIVDRIFPESGENPERRLADMASKLLSAGQHYRTELIEADLIPISSMAQNLCRSCGKQKWLPIEEDISHNSINVTDQAYFLPHSLATWIPTAAAPRMTTLETLGVRIGQGLRTGANAFFYVNTISQHGDEVEIEMGSKFKRLRATIPASIAPPVLRRQSELSDEFVVNASSLAGRVLAIQSSVLSEDISTNIQFAGYFDELPNGLAHIVRAADKIKIRGKHIRDLSAVRPNIRKGDWERGILPRFWYMLPEFTPRHKPDLLIARVNGQAPKAFLNENREVVVDANFSTIWIGENSVPDVWALLALLNSAWCWAALELSSAVMGGGALKVEAIHLRRLPIPVMLPSEWRCLSNLGRTLAISSKKETLEAIDSTLATVMLGRPPNQQKINELLELARNARARRNNHEK